MAALVRLARLYCQAGALRAWEWRALRIKIAYHIGLDFSDLKG